MSHFDLIDPNVLTLLCPLFFYTVRLIWRPTCVGLHPPPPHMCQVQPLSAFLTKRFSRADNAQLCTQNHQCHQIFNLCTLLMNLSQVEYLHNLLFNHSIAFANYFAPSNDAVTFFKWRYKQMTGFFITHTKVTNYIYRLLYGFSNVLCATRSRSVRYGSQTSTEDFLKAF
jgi:hypothetical protein